MRSQQRTRRGSSASQSQASQRDSRSTNAEANAQISSSSRRAPASDMVKRDKWIWLNVGGTYFQTSNPTLTRLSSTNSSLYRLCTNSTNVPFDRDERGAFLIDRDPAYFAVLLNFLRHGHLLLTRDTSEEGLLLEAEFFNIPDLQRLLIQRIQDRALNYLVSQKNQLQSGINGHQLKQAAAAAVAGASASQLGFIGSGASQLAANQVPSASASSSSSLGLASSSAMSSTSNGCVGASRTGNVGALGSGPIGSFNSFGLGAVVGPQSSYSGLLEV